MCTIRKAREVLAHAEGALRKLMEEGLKQQRYGDVGQIAILTEGVARLASGRAVAVSASSLLPSAPATSKPKVMSSAQRSASKKSAKNADYPRYERNGDKLVKVGWSKKHRNEYEHRAPRAAVLAVVRHLSSQVKVDQVFEVQEIMPVADPSGGDVPGYQVYLVLGWLGAVGAVEKKGRDGYVLRDPLIGGHGVDSLWDSLIVQAA